MQIPITSSAFGDYVSVQRENPEFRKLQSGIIHELNVTIKDSNNNLINNHGLPMSVVFEIISK